MKTLIALFSNTWSQFTMNENWVATPVELKSYALEGKLWKTLLNNLEDVEVAVFQSSLLQSNDSFSESYRRFIQVGSELSDKVANVFELGFEKGYSHVLFVESILANTSTEKITEAVRELTKGKMVFVPDSRGSVLLAGMPAKTYHHWQTYSFGEQDSIVEILSECYALGIPYHLMEPYSLEEAKSSFRRQLV
jgi:hypothetical protein